MIYKVWKNTHFDPSETFENGKYKMLFAHFRAGLKFDQWFFDQINCFFCDQKMDSILKKSN